MNLSDDIKNDIYNPIAERYLEQECGEERLQQAITKIKSISNDHFTLTESGYRELARLFIVSDINFKNQTHEMLSKKLQITQALIAFTNALVHDSPLTCSTEKGFPYKITIKDTNVLLNIYRALLSDFEALCQYEIKIALFSMGRRKLFPQLHTSQDVTQQYTTPSHRLSTKECAEFMSLSLNEMPTQPAIKVLERIKEYLEQEVKHSQFTSTPIAILAPIIYQIIKDENNIISITTPLYVFIYDIMVQMGHAKKIEEGKGVNREKRDLIKRYLPNKEI